MLITINNRRNIERILSNGNWGLQYASPWIAKLIIDWDHNHKKAHLFDDKGSNIVTLERIEQWPV